MFDSEATEILRTYLTRVDTELDWMLAEVSSDDTLVITQPNNRGWREGLTTGQRVDRLVGRTVITSQVPEVINTTSGTTDGMQQGEQNV